MARVVAVIHAFEAATAVELRCLERSGLKGYILKARIWLRLSMDHKGRFCAENVLPVVGEELAERAAEAVSEGRVVETSWFVAAYRFHDGKRQVIRVTVENRPRGGCPEILGVINVEVSKDTGGAYSYQVLELDQALIFQRKADCESVLCVTPTEIQEGRARREAARAAAAAGEGAEVVQS